MAVALLLGWVGDRDQPGPAAARAALARLLQRRAVAQPVSRARASTPVGRLTPVLRSYERGSELVLAPSSAPLPVIRTPCGTIIIPMATISSRNAVQASWPEHNTLGVPHPTRRSDSGTQGDRRVRAELALGDPGGTGRSRHDPTRIGARPGAKTARRRKRRVACGAHSRMTSRPPWRVRSASPARRVRLDRCASPIRRGSGHAARVDNCEQVLDACAEPCGLPAESKWLRLPTPFSMSPARREPPRSRSPRK